MWTPVSVKVLGEHLVGEVVTLYDLPHVVSVPFSLPAQIGTHLTILG